MHDSSLSRAAGPLPQRPAACCGALIWLLYGECNRPTSYLAFGSQASKSQCLHSAARLLLPAGALAGAQPLPQQLPLRCQPLRPPGMGVKLRSAPDWSPAYAAADVRFDRSLDVELGV